MIPSCLSHANSCNLSIIAINDVYELDSLPNVATCKHTCQQQNSFGKVISILAGDFLSPSLMSSLDRGKAMVDCMNSCGIDYVCFGNHEADIEMAELSNRIAESKFQWINSNMNKLPLPSQLASKVPKYQVIELQSSNGMHCRRVALLGMITEEPGLLRVGAFGYADIEPIHTKFAEIYDEIMDMEKVNGGVDLIIPITHQNIQGDRRLPFIKPCPIIIGGHDHDIIYEEVNNCIITKSGSDAKNIAIINLSWNEEPNHQSQPFSISYALKESCSFPPDLEVESKVIQHKIKLQQILSELESTELCPIACGGIQDGMILSSKGVRLQQVTMGTFISTSLRNAMNADCCLLAAGGIRGDSSYEGKSVFTYAHLRQELPFPNPAVVVQLPGCVIEDTLRYTRALARCNPPEENAAFMQTDDSIYWDINQQVIVRIAGGPLKKDHIYSVVMCA